MVQYQSFPDAHGDSHSLEKLQALRLPPLKGRSFLDVGCNEGFFCGFASFAGARRVVGLDQSETFIQRAAQRFPNCEFLCQSWDSLPDELFDVVLVASSLHYADDQEALLHGVVDRLVPTGILVLELGIVRSAVDDWLEVKRGIDTRRFPTMRRLESILQRYAWKHIGPSVDQAGDPTARHVVHVRKRQPYAILLMNPPACGKTTFVRFAFRGAPPRTISGDQLLSEIAAGKIAAPDKLKQYVTDGFSILSIAEKTIGIFEHGLSASFLDVVCKQSERSDFIFDSFVPHVFHHVVEEHFRARGFFPVSVNIEDAAHALPTKKEAERSTRSYFKHLKRSAKRPGVPEPAPVEGGRLPRTGSVGFAERVCRGRGRLVVEGWAVHCSGTMPEIIAIRVGGRLETARQFARIRRPDVQRHFGLATQSVGFRIEVADVPRSSEDTEQPVEVFAGNSEHELSGPFRVVSTARLDDDSPDEVTVAP